MESIYTIFCYVSTLIVAIGCFALILRGYRAIQKAEEQEWKRRWERQLKELPERS